MTPAGIEPATYRFLAQYLNHCATSVPETPVTYVDIRRLTRLGNHTPPTTYILGKLPITHVGRNSSVSIATRYWLDGSGIEFRWKATFSAPVQRSPGAHLASYTVGTWSLLWVKRPGRDLDHPPPPSTAEVEGKVELYIFSPSGPPWPVIG